MLISIKDLRTIISFSLAEASVPFRKQVDEYLNKGYFMTFPTFLKSVSIQGAALERLLAYTRIP